MTKKLSQSLLERAGSERWSLSLSKIERTVFYLLLLFLPTQLGLHFWPNFAYIQGVRVDYLSPTLYLTDILILFLFLLAVFNRKLKIKANIYFIFFFILLAFGLLFSKTPQEAFYGIVKLTEFIFLGLYVYRYIKIDDLFLRILSVSVVFESLLGIAQFLNKGSIGGPLYFFGERSFNSQTPNIANASIGGELILRPYATFPHPNVLAGFLLISVSFIFLFAKPREINEKIFYTFSVLLGGICLVLSLGRVAVFGLFVLVVFKSLELIKNKSVKKLSLVISSILLIAFLLLPYSTRFTSFNFSDQSFVMRKDLIIASLSMIRNNPIFGVGINNFLINLPTDYLSQGSVFYLQPVHNIFLLAISQLGIIAGAMFLTFLIKAFQKASLYLKFVLFLVCTLGFFDHYFLTLQQGQLLLTVVLGLCFAKTAHKLNLLK